MKSRTRSLSIILAMCVSSASQAAIFTTQLSGPAESPANTSPGTGSGTVDFNLANHSFSLNTSFGGLFGTTTVAHIHCCTTTQGIAPVATQVPSFVGFPQGVTSGTYSRTFDTLNAATWNPSFVTANGGTLAGAEAALANGLAAGTSYLNIHTTTFPGGEIRGFLTASATGRVPEPPVLALFALAMGALVVARRKAKSDPKS